MAVINQDTFIITLQSPLYNSTPSVYASGEYDLQNFPLKNYNFFSAHSDQTILLEVPFAPIGYRRDDLTDEETEGRYCLTSDKDGIYYKINHMEAFKGTISAIYQKEPDNNNTLRAPVSVLFIFYKERPNQLQKTHGRIPRDSIWGELNPNTGEATIRCDPMVRSNGYCQFYCAISSVYFETNFTKHQFILNSKTGEEVYGSYIKSNNNYLEYYNCAKEINYINIKILDPVILQVELLTKIPFVFLFF